MNTELLRFIDSISRDKNIDKASVFDDLEAAMVSAVRKAFDAAEDVVVAIDRATGDIAAAADGKPIDMRTLGRIAAQTARQVMIQRIREDERNSIFEEYSERVGTVVTGTVTRYEGGALIVALGRAEGIMPRGEQIPGESHHTGERIRAMILDVREEPNRVRIELTQTHPDYIRRLFELEVPEVNERVILIRELAREAGYRTKLAVSSIDSKVDAVGACVGVRGSRIRNIVDELGGEKIDIVRWNESSQILISNALKPAEVRETFLCFEMSRATVIVDEDQLSLAIGKRGQNVRLAARLTGWDIEILTPAEYDKNVDEMERALKGIEGVEDVMLDKLLAMGMVSLSDLTEVGVDPLVSELELEPALAAHLIEVARSGAKRIAAEAEAAKLAAAEAKASESTTTEPNGTSAAVDDTASAGPEVVEDAASAESGAESPTPESATPLDGVPESVSPSVSEEGTGAESIEQNEEEAPDAIPPAGSVGEDVVVEEPKETEPKQPELEPGTVKSGE